MIPTLSDSISFLISMVIIGAASAGSIRMLQETEIRDLLDRFHITAAWVSCSWCCGTWVSMAVSMAWFHPSMFLRFPIVAIAALWFAVRFGKPNPRIVARRDLDYLDPATGVQAQYYANKGDGTGTGSGV